MTDTYLLHLHHETSSAWKVSESGDEDDAFWLPKSQVTTDERNHLRNRSGLSERAYEFEIPDWLATERGLT